MTGPTSDPPQLSPDRRFWWDGSRWNPMPAAAPAQPVSTSGGCVGAATAVILLLILTVVVAGAISGSFSVTVDSWHVGSADVSGTVSNGTHSGCTDPEITLHLLDHNDAKVRDFTFGAGELAAREHRNWTTHMVGFLYIDAPVEPRVTQITAEVTCEDQH